MTHIYIFFAPNTLLLFMYLVEIESNTYIYLQIA